MESQPGDERLMEAYQGGDQESFNELYRRYFRPLTAYLHHRLPDGSRQEAEDLAENTLLKAAVEGRRFRPALGKFRPWLYSIAANQRRDYLRALTRRLATVLPWVSDGRLEAVADPGGLASERLAERDLLSSALAQLTQRQRDVLLLTFWEGFSYEETGRILGIRPGSVGAHRDRALKRLRHILSEPARASEPILATKPLRGVQT